MRTADEAGQQIKAALKLVDNLSVYDDPSATFRPPAALVGAPRLRCEIGSRPTSATFFVFVAVSVGDKSIGQLVEMIPDVIEAIESNVDNAVVAQELEPVALVANGSTSLPAYMIPVDVDL
jgi:hypothetical protein